MLLLQGHYDSTQTRVGELWGLAVSPTKNEFVSSGSDYRVRKWSIDKNIQLSMSQPFDEDIRAVDWSPNGDVIVAADRNSICYLLDSSLKVIDKLNSKIN